MKAKIVNNLIEVIDEYFKGTYDYKNDDYFIEFAKRIQGKVVNLVFVHGDAFEEIDNNYWLPDCCFTLI